MFTSTPANVETNIGDSVTLWWETSVPINELLSVYCKTRQKEVFSKTSHLIVHPNYISRTNITIDKMKIGLTLRNITQEDFEEPLILVIYMKGVIFVCEDHVSFIHSPSGMLFCAL